MIATEVQGSCDSPDRNGDLHSARAIRRIIDWQSMLLENQERMSWLETIVDSFPGKIFAKNAAGQFIFGNCEMLRAHGIAEANEIVGKTDYDFYAPERAEQNFEIEQSLIRSGKPLLDLEEEFLGADGRGRCMLVSKIPVYGSTGVPTGIIGFCYDISNRKEAERLMLGQANTFGMIARSLPLEEIVSGIIRFIEGQLPGAIGSVQLLSPDGRHLTEAIAPNLPEDYRSALDPWPVGCSAGSTGTAAASGEIAIASDILVDASWTGRTESALRSGIRSCWASPIISYQGDILGTLSFYHSRVSVPSSAQSDLIAMASHMVGFAVERKQSERRIQFLAHHDTLTGLPNRLLLEDRLSSTLDVARTHGGLITLGFFDLDHFKLINDSLGHDAGDHLLRASPTGLSGASVRLT